jgi:peptide/nickel transport system permease protein
VIVRRLVVMLPVLALATFFVYGLVAVIPGNPAVALAGDNPTPQRIAEISHLMGLDRPFLVRYFEWLGHAVRFDLGHSLYSSSPVWDEIKARIPATASLAILTLLLSFVVGSIAGTIAGMRQGRALDRGTTLGVSLGVAIPNFWLGLVLVIILALNLRLLPAVGYVPLTENPWQWFLHLILPSIALGAATAAEIARQARSAVIQVVSEDYVRTARAKGLPPWKVVIKHVLKNAAVPVVTVSGLQAARLVGGTVIIEQIFAMPGLGSFAYAATVRRDFPQIQGVVLVCAVFILLINLLVDLSYAYFNPRSRRA